jgi:tetratricopeptide (TPR) repeat protein
MNITESHFLKALSNYPKDIEKVIENLNHSLSSDYRHAPSLCLMGKVFAQEIKDYSLAEHYFKKALKADYNYAETHINYIKLLLIFGNVELMEKQIELSKHIVGVNLCELYLLKAKSSEMHRDFNQALQTIEMALTLSCTEEIDKELEEFKKRIYRKMKSNIIAQNRDEISLYRWLKTYSY